MLETHLHSMHLLVFCQAFRISTGTRKVYDDPMNCVVVHGYTPKSRLVIKHGPVKDYQKPSYQGPLLEKID